LPTNQRRRTAHKISTVGRGMRPTFGATQIPQCCYTKMQSCLMGNALLVSLFNLTHKHQ
jgi:hypothetical protein